jgi:hypothetical protein
MKIPEPLAEALRIKSPDDTQVYLTTAGRDGKPNVSVQQFTDVLRDEYVLLPDLFAQKTKVNLNENLVGAISIAHPERLRGWVLEGPCNVFQWGHPPNYAFAGLKAGEILGGWGDWEAREPMDELPEGERPAVLAQRGVIVLKVEGVRRPEETR